MIGLGLLGEFNDSGISCVLFGGIHGGAPCGSVEYKEQYYSPSYKHSRSLLMDGSNAFTCAF